MSDANKFFFFLHILSELVIYKFYQIKNNLQIEVAKSLKKSNFNEFSHISGVLE